MPKKYSQSERENIRKDLIRQAERCLYYKGIGGTSVDELVRAVRIPKGTFYLFYPSKEDLFLQVLQYYISSGFHGPDGTRRDSDDWREHLRTVAKSCLNSARSPERSA